MKSVPLNQIVAECTCFHLRRTARVVTQIFDEYLAPGGLKATQFTLLVALARSGSAAVTALSRALGMDRTTLTRNLKPLQRQGWVEIVTGEDRRTRAIRLTGAGRKALGQASPLWQSAQREVVRRIGKPRWRDLMQHLDAATGRLHPD